METEIESIQFNGIEFKCEALISFSSLTKLLYELAKKHKELDKKVKDLSQQMQDKDQRISDLELQIKINRGDNQKKSLKNDNEIKEETYDDLDENIFIEGGINHIDTESGIHPPPNNMASNNNNNIGGANDQDADDDNKAQNLAGNNVKNDTISELNKSQETKKSKESSVSPEIITKMYKTLKVHTSQIEMLKKRANEHPRINDNIKKNEDDFNSKYNQLKHDLDELAKKFADNQIEFENMKVKVQDFNIYDVFKGEGVDGDIDAAKILIQTLENKVFKKFALIDERAKKNDNDIFKIDDQTKKLKALVESLERKVGKTQEDLGELGKEHQIHKEITIKKIKELRDDLDDLLAKFNKLPNFTEFEAKMQDKIDNAINELLEKLNKNKPISRKSSSTNVGVQMRPEDMEMLKNMNKRINDLDKNVKIQLNNLGIEDIKKSIAQLEADMLKKTNKTDFSELEEKFRQLEEYVKDLNFKFDGLQQFSEKLKNEQTQINRKIEYLSGEYGKLAFSGGKASEGAGKGPIMDVSKYLDLNTFNEYKKDTNAKFEKIKLNLEEFARTIEEILNQLKHTPSDKDFAQFQTIIKNMIEDLRITCNKKYADKYDINKTLKYLEAQIKMLLESNKKAEGADNWLLAKKPIGNFMCASCEAVLKNDLATKNEYIPWNKYPNREEKNYRMGHGFSRMLQMVNNDIIRTAEQNRELYQKGYISDEEKKMGRSKMFEEANSTGGVKLPKVKTNKGNKLNIDGQTLYGTTNDLNTDIAVERERPQIMKIYKMNRNTTNNSKITPPPENKNVSPERRPIELNIKTIPGEEIQITGPGNDHEE